MNILYYKMFGIGNVINGTPAIKLLHSAFPNCTIDVVCEKRGYEVLQGWDLINDIILEPPTTINRQYDVIIVGTPSHGCPRPKKYNYTPGTIIGNWRESMPKDTHEALANIRLVHQVCANFGVDIPKNQPTSHCQSWDYDLKFSRPFIVYHQGCFVGYEFKMWNGSVPFLQMVLDKGIGVVLIGGEREVRDNKNIEKSLQGNVLNFTGTLTLEQSAGIIKLCDMMVCNDSGPMHVASAVGTPVMVTWGPTSWVKNHPWTKKDMYKLVKLNLDCQPCQFTPTIMTCSHRDCLRKMSPELVFREFLKYWRHIRK